MSEWNPDFDYLDWLKKWRDHQPPGGPLGEILHEAVQFFSDTNEALAACQSESKAKIRSLEAEVAKAQAHSENLFRQLIEAERKRAGKAPCTHRSGFDFQEDMSGGYEYCADCGIQRSPGTED